MSDLTFDDTERRSAMRAAAAPAREFTPRPLRDLHAPRSPLADLPRSPTGGLWKRACDIIFGTALLLALSPLLFLIALAISLESRGSPLFLQRRGGFRGRIFLIYKFRTMRTCDDGSDVAQAQEGDKRVTRLGGVLRKLSIDELPQLINVVLGEMSLIGPRPHAVAHDRNFLKVDPDYRARWSARPGITGLAQVSGCRGLTETEESVRKRVAFDLRYIEKWSPFMDAYILIKTVLVVWGDRKAF